MSRRRHRHRPASRGAVRPGRWGLLGWCAALTVALVADVLSGVIDASSVGRPDDYAVLRGVNVYTLEDVRNAPNAVDLPGEPASSYEYLAHHGVKLVRLAVPWMLLQPVPAGGTPRDGLSRPLSARYLATVRTEIAAIERAGLFPVLDLHNGCDYPSDPRPIPPDELFCGRGLTQSDVVQVWTQLSEAFADDDHIAGYDLFNEPSYNRIGSGVYRSYTRAVVSALRARGDRHTVWVEAMIPRSMRDLAPNGPWIDDPLHRVEYSAHFYPDYKDRADGSYTGAAANAPFLAAIRDFGQWCRTGHVRCSIGEIGWPGGTAPPRRTSDQAAWNALGDQAYDLADEYELDVTYFGAASNSSSTLWAYGASSSALSGAARSMRAAGISTTFAQARVVEEHPSLRRP